MKIKVKRLITAIMLLCAVLNSMCFAAPTLEGTKYELYVHILNRIRIMGGQSYSGKVSKAEMAKYLVLMNDLEDFAIKGTTDFIDVDAEHWASGYIKATHYMGYLTYKEVNNGGTIEKYFEPNEIITNEEAIIWCVKTLGYKEASIKKAEELNLLKNLNCSYSDYAIHGDMAILMWNTLNTPVQGKDKTLFEMHFANDRDDVQEIIDEYEETEEIKTKQEISFANNINLYNAVKSSLSSQGVEFDFYDATRTINIKIENVIELQLNDKSISSIEELKYFTSLEELYLENNMIEDISVLEKLKNIEVLTLEGNKIKNINALENLKELHSLSLENNRVTDVSVLKNLENIYSLSLSNCGIADIKVIPTLISLKKLKLKSNNVSDISSLKRFTQLEYLNLEANQITDIGVLANLKKLKELNLNDNNISDITALAELTNLYDLSLSINKISDISPLSNLDLSMLHLRDNKIGDITSLENYSSMLELNLGKNNITDIKALKNLTSCVLWVNENNISDMSPISSKLGQEIQIYFVGSQILAKDIDVNESKIELPSIFINQNIKINVVGNIKATLGKKKLEIENAKSNDKIILIIKDGDYKDSTITYTFFGTSIATPTQTPTVTEEIKNKYQITAQKSQNGKVTPSGVTEVVEGDSQKYKIVANDGYEIEDVLVDGRSVGKIEAYRFADVTKNHIIEAKFGEIEDENSKEIEFDDVTENDWFNKAVKYITKKELMKGFGNNKFSPNSNVTRGMVVAVLYRLSGVNENEYSTFVDVSNEAYYSKAIAWATKKGIANGVGDNSFLPDAEITREQLVTIIYRYSYMIENGKKGDTKDNLVNYEDNNEVNSYAVDAFRWGVKEGIINGRTEKNLAPQGTANRAEFATMLMRFIEM